MTYMNILMLSSTFPYPPTRGGTQVRTFHLLKYLSQRHTVTLATQREGDVTDAEVAELGNCVDHLAIFERPSDSGTHWNIEENTAIWSIFATRDTTKRT